MTANLLARLAACCADTRARPAARLAAAAPLVIAALGLVSMLGHKYRRQVEWHLGIISRCAYLDQYHLCVPIQLGEFIRSHTDPDTPIFTFINDYDIFIHTVARRRNAVRFAPTIFVDMARPPFRHASRWHEEFESALRDDPPRYIITCNRPAPTTRPRRLLLDSLNSDYLRVGSWQTDTGLYECFERDSPARRAGGAVTASVHRRSLAIE